LGEGGRVDRVLGDQLLEAVEALGRGGVVGEAHPDVVEADAAGQVVGVLQVQVDVLVGVEPVGIEHDAGDGPGFFGAGGAVLGRVARWTQHAHDQRVAHVQAIFVGHAALDQQLVLAGLGPTAAFQQPVRLDRGLGFEGRIDQGGAVFVQNLVGLDKSAFKILVVCIWFEIKGIFFNAHRQGGHPGIIG
jgi:hypothetical protein